MEIFAPLMGASFRGKENMQIVKGLTLDDGELLSLETDPTNEYDQHAVKVIFNPTGAHIGFVARENNFEVFQALEQGEKLQVEIVGFENSLKPTMLISSIDIPLTAEDMGEYPGDR